MSHLSLIGAITEAAAIREELNCSVDEAFEFQRNIARFRIQYERACAERAAYTGWLH